MDIDYKSVFVLESISRQTDGFGDKLTKIVKLITDDVDDGKKITRKHPAVEELSKAIYARLGLKVDITTGGAIAAIMPFYSNRNHVFLHEYWRGHNNLIKKQTEILKNIDGKTGTVDLAKAKVSGIFSEYNHPLHLNFNTLRTGYALEADEIAAVLLHELGHAFYCCYYANRTDTTNQVLLQLSKDLTNSDKRTVEYIYKELHKVAPDITKAEIDNVLHANKVVAGIQWFKTIVKVVRASTVNSKYDETSFEQLADNFPSRFGMGRSLTEGLDKLHVMAPEKNRAVFFIEHFLSILVTVFLLVTVGNLLALGAVLPGMFYGLMTYLFFRANGEDYKDYTYDKLKIRYQRVRNDAIEQLKQLDMSTEEVKKLIETIKVIDDIMKDVGNYKPLPTAISNLIFPGARQAMSAIEIQQTLEKLSANDLFLKSSEFRII